MLGQWYIAVSMPITSQIVIVQYIYNDACKAPVGFLEERSRLQVLWVLVSVFVDLAMQADTGLNTLWKVRQIVAAHKVTAILANQNVVV